ncbi:structural cement protein Gp24 [Pandoraea terrigena]|uniref:Uncharacterized protein n=1 Tax=Pandoraea terrigena TaxID=2508292 RepID=A0A5E4V733_9BURK|nr:hypothetical protein [Pandoraea terrigena]VVE07384.1 hypothetical protein PTE31013_02460 [Pandoraea terrigena]
MSGFQTSVNLLPQIGISGDRSTDNPESVLSRIANTVLTVGTFVWPLAADPVNQVTQSGTGSPLGFVKRDQQGLITAFLGQASMQIPAGQTAQISEGGEYFVLAPAAATAGQKVFATLADGTLQFGAKGATISGAIETKFVVSRGGASGAVIEISTHSQLAGA